MTKVNGYPRILGAEAENQRLRSRCAELETALTGLAEIVRDMAGMFMARGRKLSRRPRGEREQEHRRRVRGLREKLGLTYRQIAEVVNSTAGAVGAMCRRNGWQKGALPPKK